MTIDKTLSTRNSTHGDFAENARIAQEFKNWLREQPGYRNLTHVQMEALDLIATKLARILSGKASYDDHWHDIAGYAGLAETECKTIGLEGEIATALGRSPLMQRLQSSVGEEIDAKADIGR